MLSTGSSAMSMMAAQQSDAQAAQTGMENIQQERLKAQMDRLKNKENLRDHMAKQAAKIHENRAKTGQEHIRIGEGLTK